MEEEDTGDTKVVMRIPVRRKTVEERREGRQSRERARRQRKPLPQGGEERGWIDERRGVRWSSFPCASRLNT